MSFSPYNGKAPFTYISYTPNDKDAALQIAGFLREHGINVWLDLDNKPDLRVEKLKEAHAFVALIGKGCDSTGSNVYTDIGVFLSKNPDERYCVAFLDNIEQEIDDAAVDSGGIELLLKAGCDKFGIDEQLRLLDAIKEICTEKSKGKKKKAIIKLLIAVAGVIVVLVAGLMFYNFQYPIVTDTVGSNSEVSIFALEKLGFSIMRSYEYSYGIPENEIISQSYIGRLRRGSTINMTISLGAKAIPFEDALFNELIKQGLDANGDRRISQEEVATLQNLNVSGIGISSINGLEYATALVMLDISDNNISDITYLSRLALLTELYADNNLIVDISPLVSAEQLSVLYIRNNQISDITSLEFFNSLQEVYLSGNLIEDTYPAMRITNDLD